MLTRGELAEEVAVAYDCILQSKRLMLLSVQRRLRAHPTDDLRRRAQHLESEVDRLSGEQLRLCLNSRQTGDPHFWIAVYSSLLSRGQLLAERLDAARRRDGESVLGDVDIPLMNSELAVWRARMRSWMVEAAASAP